MRETQQFIRGRIGEILQYWWYHSHGVELQDLADRTENRAPLLHGETSIVAPDTNALKTARFFLEFKTKTHHQQWRGGSADDDPKISARMEEGIDSSKLIDYREAEKRWRMPVVLSILSIRDSELRAATLDQLGDPRHSSDSNYPIVNWHIGMFDLLAQFDRARLDRLFNSDEPKAQELRAKWLSQMPRYHEVKRILDWLKPAQQEFAELNQHIFDAIEKHWK